MHNKSEITDKDDVFTCHECGAKKKILSPKQELNSWPPRYPLDTLTTELRETWGELHVCHFFSSSHTHDKLPSLSFYSLILEFTIFIIYYTML